MSGWNHPYNTRSNTAQNSSSFSPQNNSGFSPQNNSLLSSPQNNSLSAPSWSGPLLSPTRPGEGQGQNSKILNACDTASYFLGSVQPNTSKVIPLQNQGQNYEASNGRFNATCTNCFCTSGGNFQMLESSGSTLGQARFAGQCQGNCKEPVNFQFGWGAPGSQGRLQ